MAALDPFDMLVRLGKITQDQLRAADLVAEAQGTSTRAARLVAVGVDKERLLQALSALTRMPVAAPERLARAGPMALPSAATSATMKELLAVPIGRIDDDILEVAVADPRTTTKLRDAAIAHRPFLALEADVIAALARVFPDAEVLDDPFAEPTLRNASIAPRPVSVEAPPLASGAAAAAGAPAAAAAPDPDATDDDDHDARDDRSDDHRDRDGDQADARGARVDPGPTEVAAFPPLGEIASTSDSVGPFVRAETTERVRRPSLPERAPDPAAEDDAEPRRAGGVDDDGAWAPSSQGADRMRAIVRGVERVDARKLSVIALAAVVAAIAVLVVVVLAAREGDGDLERGDAGVVAAAVTDDDAGTVVVSSVADAGVVAQKKPHAHPPRRAPPHKKKRAARGR